MTLFITPEVITLTLPQEQYVPHERLSAQQLPADKHVTTGPPAQTELCITQAFRGHAGAGARKPVAAIIPSARRVPLSFNRATATGKLVYGSVSNTLFFLPEDPAEQVVLLSRRFTAEEKQAHNIAPEQTLITDAFSSYSDASNTRRGMVNPIHDALKHGGFLKHAFLNSEVVTMLVEGPESKFVPATPEDKLSERIRIETTLCHEPLPVAAPFSGITHYKPAECETCEGPVDESGYAVDFNSYGDIEEQRDCDWVHPEDCEDCSRVVCDSSC